MTEYLELSCGCRFKKLQDNPLRLDITLDTDHIPLDCPKTWQLFGEGNTKGIFQLEQQQGLTAQLKPENIEQLAALTAIIRPGSSQAMRGGKSVTKHYIDRKNKEEAVDYVHPELESVLSKTYGELIYQEGALQIVKKIAGFSLEEADILRKAIGKKKPELMAKIKKQFLDGCEKMGLVNKETAVVIFEGIEKSQRYSFNKSHAVSYAYNAYLSAYCKAHFPRVFFTSYLTYAKEKQKPLLEISELVRNARAMNISVMQPDIRKQNHKFRLIDKVIYFGLCDVKSVGKSVVNKLNRVIGETCDKIGKTIDDLEFMDFLLHVFPTTSIKVENLISVGAFDHLKLSRTYMIYMAKIFRDLKERELCWIVENTDTDDIKELFDIIIAAPTGKKGCCYTKRRLEKVKDLYKLVLKPPHKMNDMIPWISSVERELLGLSLTMSDIDACDISSANCNCKEYLDGFNPIGGVILVAGLIERVHEIKTKTGKDPGKKMAFVNISDITGAVDSVVFPEPWDEFKGLCAEGNTVMISGKRDSKQKSLIVSKIWQI